MAKLETYEIRVNAAASEEGKVHIVADGEESEADTFELIVPVGTGLLVKKVVRVELVKE